MGHALLYDSKRRFLSSFEHFDAEISGVATYSTQISKVVQSEGPGERVGCGSDVPAPFRVVGSMGLVRLAETRQIVSVASEVVFRPNAPLLATGIY